MKSQLDIAQRLQQKWLERMEVLLDEGAITSTDMATLARVLMANGWTLDPTKIPSGLRDKLGDPVDLSKLENSDLLGL